MSTVLFNPYTGTPRHPSDIQSDPQGLLIVDPESNGLRAAAQGPIMQWQKKHTLRTNNRWENTDEYDAKWWLENSKGWEIRPLYAAPQPKEKQ